MERDRCRTTIRVPKLFVGAFLSYFFEPFAPQKRHDFLRFQDRDIAHGHTTTIC